MKSLWDLMNYSSEVNDKQQNFLDVMSCGWENFNPKLPLTPYVVEEVDIDHFDRLCYNFYGVSFYDDMILWYNHTYKHDLLPGQIIYFPNIIDILNYYNENRK